MDAIFTFLYYVCHAHLFTNRSIYMYTNQNRRKLFLSNFRINAEEIHIVVIIQVFTRRFMALQNKLFVCPSALPSDCIAFDLRSSLKMLARDLKL